ncbi:30S ribosomal protein S13 [Candidatus Peregrinibacteria bacterium CG11_big_fil_rev_8_21_14_0_20_46_8]|nr:MAG: 30S ribosomal protein S13 [Candidatus Peregrinibacteria bacterium CG11_big_fil_rev_8_21_14_0_20_46_8]
MIRLAGITIPDNKRIKAGLMLVYGIGWSKSHDILAKLNIDPDTKASELSETDLNRIREFISKMPIEGDLRRKIQLDIKRLQEIGSYRGLRHRKRLPVRGQRTKTNARTRKGKKKTVANKKKVTK